MDLNQRPGRNPGDWAWLTIGIAVVLYEGLAAVKQDWELLSETMDGYRNDHPAVTDLTIVYLAGHLLRLWPARIDPLTQFSRALQRCASK